MLNFDPTVRCESESLPGVSFIVRRLSVIERSKVDLSILDHQVRAAELQEQILRLEKERNGDESDTHLEHVRLDFELGCIINAHLKPAYIAAGLVSIEGMQHGGKQANAQSLLANGPDSLINEVWLSVNQHARLSGDQEKNSSSPSTSPDQAMPEGTPTTALIASDGDSIERATAAAGSPTT